MARGAAPSSWQGCEVEAQEGMAGGELAQVGRSQRLQMLIEYLACAQVLQGFPQSLRYDLRSEELALITAARACHVEKETVKPGN